MFWITDSDWLWIGGLNEGHGRFVQEPNQFPERFAFHDGEREVAVGDQVYQSRSEGVMVEFNL